MTEYEQQMFYLARTRNGLLEHIAEWITVVGFGVGMIIGCLSFIVMVEAKGKLDLW